MPTLSDFLMQPGALTFLAFSVFLVGIAKSGFAAGLAIIGVPAMSLIISPVQAAGILLPILVAMDVIALAVYRREAAWEHLYRLVPAACLGIAIGWALSSYVNEMLIRLIVGSVAVLFTLDYLFKLRPNHRPGKVAAGGLGILAGFTSFVSHAGAPPMQMYLLPQRLAVPVYAGTHAIFFAAVNGVKLIPYFALGQLSADNLTLSVALVPAACLGIALGIWLVRHISPEPFYRLAYLLVFLVGVKLIWDGVRGLMPLA